LRDPRASSTIDNMSDHSESKALTYSSYLKIDELLDLQQPKSEEHDEMLFIIIHQVYELWFKQVKHELLFLQGVLEGGNGVISLAGFNRVLTILKTMVGQIDILETMSPHSFLTFRALLESASGFQSAQFREVEFLLGMKNERMLAHHPEGTAGRARIEEAFAKPTLWDSFLRFLVKGGHPVPPQLLERDVTLPIEPNEALQDLLVGIYRAETLEGQVCERLVDLDEGLQEWRYRHVKMVERTIGHKQGSGGSEGAAYLKSTLFAALFPDLWAIRTQL
jgi:tryptophan 2,3-dioxygenase